MQSQQHPQHNPLSGKEESISELQLDNLSNLILNANHGGGCDEDALIDQYEHEVEKLIDENLLLEREQANQRLFQSFQTSACAVVQMFKDRTDADKQATTTTTTATNNESSPPERSNAMDGVREANTTTNSAASSTTTTSASAASPQLTQWQSFQNSAGAITVLYKGALCIYSYMLNKLNILYYSLNDFQTNR